ncbi:hypothetical protein AB0M02_12920 [Actinoplanes sp. NPDC051861]|uniref:hypothetical protein n=1 Tax=Actinoplanes sp. NPDC051861 TaxID=3155170 RepID=UPI0034157210
MELSATEKLVREGFARGAPVDLGPADDQVVRAEVLRHLLLGGVPAADGELPGLRLQHARVTGRLELSYADVTVMVILNDCRFDERITLHGAHLRRLNLAGSTLNGIAAENATIAGGLSLRYAVVHGTIDLIGTRIEGALVLDGARLSAASPSPGGAPPPPGGALPSSGGAGPGGALPALDGSHLSVASSILARDGFVSDGPIWLGGATVAGSLRWCGATIRNPGGRALDAPGLKVGGVADLTDGFTVAGSIRLSNAEVGGLLSLHGAELSEPGGRCLDLRNLVAGEVNLRPRTPFPGRVDLSYARISLLRDDPATWPEQIATTDFRYEAIGGPAEVGERLRWLQRDPHGFRPQAYSQLAGVYQAAGRDDDARTVRYAAERNRSRKNRIWSALQNVTVGYGYKPVRAASWLGALLAAGTVLFTLVEPRAAEAPKAPEFHALAYTADLLLPVVDLGQQSAYHARGWTAWVAYGLIGAGLVFVTTAAAAIARRLQRG